MKINNFAFIHREKPGEGEQVPISYARDLIATIQSPLSEGELREIVSMINQESEQIAQACRQEYREKLEEVKAAEKEARSIMEQHRPKLIEAEQELRLKQTEPGNWIKAAVFIECFIACFIVEFVLTWYTLPFILSVRQFSFVGVMLAIAPTTALVILDIVLARLIEEPWQRAQAAGSSRQRTASWLAMGAFLLALGAMNIYTVSMLAEAREESMKAKRNLERLTGEGEIVVDTEALNRAVLAVSICVAIDGALFYLIGMAELRRLRAWMNSRRKTDRLLAKQQYLESLHVLSEVEVAKNQALTEQIDALAETAAAHYRARHMLQVEKVKKLPRPQPSMRELANNILAKRIGAAA
jgi:hypothetical protein